MFETLDYSTIFWLKILVTLVYLAVTYVVLARQTIYVCEAWPLNGKSKRLMAAWDKMVLYNWKQTQEGWPDVWTFAGDPPFYTETWAFRYPCRKTFTYCGNTMGILK
jgi:hypothetical protein